MCKATLIGSLSLAIAPMLLLSIVCTGQASAAPFDTDVNATTQAPALDQIKVSTGGQVNLVAAPASKNSNVFTDGRRVVYSEVFDIQNYRKGRKNVEYMQLIFDSNATKLRARASSTAKSTRIAGWGVNLPGDVLKLTSLKDNFTQYLNHETLKQWTHRSAFFNGGQIRMELLVDSDDQAANVGKDGPSVVVDEIQVNPAYGRKNDYSPVQIPLRTKRNVCDFSDDRRPSSDLRVGRLFPAICTGWTINDANGCALTAAHCLQAWRPEHVVYQLQVPPSGILQEMWDGDVGVARHPSPDFQFALDPRSVQKPDDLDVAYFGTFRNPNTGKTARETAGAAFTLAAVEEFAPGRFKFAASAGAAQGAAVRVAGFGVIDGPDPERLARSMTQQSAVGRITSTEAEMAADPAHIHYAVDVGSGVSGGVVAVEATGVAIGVHTWSNCADNMVAAKASAVTATQLQHLLRNPKGVCASPAN